ncbi:MAG: DNA mismatch repair protein MutS [Spirochaetaceae bacterium]|nr:MAG: DNA mismatch repair protein MutS [Spirochaetaceae bacterium]
MMRQYRSIKSKHRDAILFFRLGDFYEMFEQDAAEASHLLDLTLTKRNGVPMCGIPYHASQGYISRLLKAGKKIAICEQTHIPKAGLASREVVEVITPGTVVDENMLDATVNNYLVSMARSASMISIAYIDLSTADFAASHFPKDQGYERFKKELLSLSPRELLIQESLLSDDPQLDDLLREHEGLVINRLPDWSFDLQANRQLLKDQFRVTSLTGLGLKEDSPEILSAGALLSYLGDTAKGVLSHIRNLQIHADASHLGLDESTLKNLELTQNLNDRSKRYTLLEVLDQCRTAIGARKLKRWLLKPLRDVDRIEQRLDLVEFFHKNQILLSKIREHLGGMFDLERLSSRVALEKAHAKDLLALKSSLSTAAEIAELLEKHPEVNTQFTVLTSKSGTLAPLVDLVDRAILEEPAILINEGNLIKPGFDGELDRMRDVKENARKLLKGYLEEERKKTGISSLKLKYNRIIGYFLEVSKSNLRSVPPYFIRRQTLVGGERFSTEVLSNMESEIHNASEQIIELERKHFLSIRAAVREQLDPILTISEIVSEIDVLQSFAFTATLYAYTRPKITDARILKIREGRHPVVEAHLPGGSFVPNDLELNSDDKRFVLLTGPNMAGKSTFLRQNALIVLMAQIGSFVPASAATVGLVDSIYCRVGATDNLARGESTFLVEMSETANILRSASERSLIIMDEVGRGTGTKDGLAIAWAVTEYILEQVGAFTLFATHYHELTALKHRRLRNLSMAVLEGDGEIVFLKQIREGPTDNSYGIHVAQLAGVPLEVVRRADQMLGELKENGSSGPSPQQRDKSSDEPAQPLLFSPEQVIRDEIRSLDLSRTTPLEALNRIAAWQKELRERSEEP